MRVAGRKDRPERSGHFQGAWRCGGSAGVVARLAVSLLAVLGMTPGRATAQSPLDSPARLAVDSVTLEQALNQLRRTAGASLLYSPDLLPTDKRVSCGCERVTVREALTRILKGTGLGFRSSDTQIRIVPVGQSKDVTERDVGAIAGHVLAVDTGEPLNNAMVQLDSAWGVLSGADGSFLIRGVVAGKHRLRVSSLGWTEEVADAVVIAAGDTARVAVRLERAQVPLPRIVVSPGTFGLLEDVSPGVKRSLTREAVQRTPQLGEDIFRAMKQLPGVAASDISTKLNVRGGADSEVLVRLDGLELYEPYHMKDWDGAVGIIDLNALGGVELTAGGFGVEHGDRMAGVLDMRSRTSLGDARTTLGVSITNVTALSRGGFAGGNGAWLLSARYGFMGIAVKLIGEDERLSPQYHDVFGKVSYQFDPANRLTAHVLRAGDRFSLHEAERLDLERVDVETGWDSDYGWLTWDAKPHPRVSASTMAWAGRVTRNRDGLVTDFGRPDMPDSMSVVDDRVFGFAGIRHDLGVELSDRALLKAGVDVRRLQADYGYSGMTSTQYLTPQGEPAVRDAHVAVDQDGVGTQVGAYLAARARPASRLTLEAGLRYDRVTHTGDENLAPRLLAAFEVGPRTSLRASWGRYWQSHGIQQLEVGDGETQYFPAERSDQIAVGVQHGLGNGVGARLELYDRAIANQRPRFINLEQDLRVFPEVEGDRLRVDPGRGRARGLELTVERREGGRWAWSASYALALAEDEVPGADGRPCTAAETCPERFWLPRQYDQRHTVGIQTAYRPARDWHLSLAWKYHSGWPATQWTYDLVTRPDSGRFWVRTFGPVRGMRLPAYHRLDVRVTRDFAVRGGTVSVFADLFNLYGRTNIASWRYEPAIANGRPITLRSRGLTLLPRLPTLGLRYEF